MRRALWLFALIAPLLMAAWPDHYPSRRAAIAALRYDLISPELQSDPAEVAARYTAACKKGFSIACQWRQWQGDDGGELEAAGAYFARKCRGEPLACVVQGWSLSRVGSALSPAAADPAAAATLFARACKKDLYAPACTSLGELYLEGVGVEASAASAEALLREGCEAKDWWGCYRLGALLAEADPAQGAALHETACQEGVPQACAALGDLLLRGDGIERDRERAATLYAQSCSDRHTRSCATLAKLYEKGAGVEKSATMAVGLYRTACAAGEHRSCYDLATLYAEGRGVTPDPDIALSLLEDTCEIGFGPACTHLGELYLTGGLVGRDRPMGISYLEDGCALGDMDGCVFMGRMFERGDGVEPDLDEAVHIYTRACDAGGGAGCAALGQLHERGVYYPEDAAEAARLYGRACSAGSGEGCGWLAELHRTGRGVEQDAALSLRYLAKGCSRGHGESCGRLGQAYADGERGLSQDPDRARSLLTRACRMGDPVGCIHMGALWLDARPPRPDLALEGYSAACEGGLEEACAQLEPLKTHAAYAEELRTALRSTRCQLWGLDESDPTRTVPVAEVRGDQITLHIGQQAGMTLPISLQDTTYQSGRRPAVGSTWAVGGGRIEHREAWPDGRSAFPGEESYATDPQGKGSLVFSRADETVAPSSQSRCPLIEGYDALTSEQCSPVQALIAGRVLSTCW